METALRYELEQHITELVGNIYPTHAPETSEKPYLVYTRINTNASKTYVGYSNYERLSYMFSCNAIKYADMTSLANKVEELLKSLIRTNIGQENIFIQNVTINNRTETWENELGVNRGIIDFTITH